MEQQAGDLLIREARPEDAAAFLAIYRPYVAQTAITFEVEVPTLEDFAGRMERIQSFYPYLAAEKDGRILGYAYAGRFHPRAAYDWCAETSIYLAMDARRQGAGGALYRALEEDLARMGVLNSNACIAVPAEGTQDPHLDNNSERFHAHLGYQLVGRFHACGYKFDTWYDMVWMEKHLGPHTVPPEKLRPWHEVKDI